jgi:ubiquinone/menaquinone biosynthesis C-methylase UbiE
MTGSGRHQRDNVERVWDSVSLSYDADQYWRLPENRANLEVLLSHIGPPEGKRVLEMGCGSGYTSMALARKGAQCTLLDLSPEALRVAAEAFASAGLPAPGLVQEDALATTLPSESFDVVWNGGVIEHFYDSGKILLLRQMYRLVTPGGKVILLVPNRLCWYFQIVQVWKKLWGTWRYGFEDDMSPGRLRRLCMRTGILPSAAYAFNPVVGWRWLPFVGNRVARFLGDDSLQRHLQRARTGFITVVVLEKPRPPGPSTP